ncbi:hypothetical protein [Pectinatus sottacetonis]|uniref:hypothetical protein n=1 Tax=Pectinatus sottacetonis TaxID=1002795 RepID=UPI0018C74508|nr:hypothetical protein [Pectinatus sottacetonis]
MSIILNGKFIDGCECRGNMLFRGEKLLPGECLISANRKFAAVMQKTGNFIICNTQKILWESVLPLTNCIEFHDITGIIRICSSKQYTIDNNKAEILLMRNDGNLAAYKKHICIWVSNTAEKIQENFFEIININLAENSIKNKSGY